MVARGKSGVQTPAMLILNVTLKVTLEASLGLALARLMEETVGAVLSRSEERRVGKEWRVRVSPSLLVEESVMESSSTRCRLMVASPDHVLIGMMELLDSP